MAVIELKDQSAEKFAGNDIKVRIINRKLESFILSLNNSTNNLKFMNHYRLFLYQGWRKRRQYFGFNGVLISGFPKC